MKLLNRVIVIVTLLLFVPVASFAIVDFGAYAGYGMGDWEDDDGSYDISGTNMGFIGHLNSGIPMLLTMGIGLYFQSADQEIEVDNVTFDAERLTYGLDFYAQLELPLPIHPYIRGGIAFKDKMDVSAPGYAETFEDSFNTIHYGFGVAITILPPSLVQIYAEYLITQATFKKDDPQGYDFDVNTGTFNVGAKVSI